MSDRASVYESAQIGVENPAARGTAVAATRALSGMSIEPGVELDVKTYKPRGRKFVTTASVNKEWTQAKVSGQACYNELPYVCASLIGNATPTTPVGATLTRQYVYSPDSDGPDTPASYTVETGSTAGAQRFSYALFVEGGIEFSRQNGVSLSGAMMGQRTSMGVSLSNGAAALDLVPIEPTDINVLVATTHAGLDAATPLTRALMTSWKLGSRFGPIWALNRTNASWAAHVETDPSGDVTFKVGADTAGLAFLETLRQGDTLFLRFDALGPEIEPDHNHALILDMALKLTKISPLEDDQGLVAVTYTAELAHDPTWGKAMQATVITDLASL